MAEKWAGVLVVAMAARWVGETAGSLVAQTAGSMDQNWVEQMVWMSVAKWVGETDGWWAAPMAGTLGANWAALRVGQ